LGIIGGSISGSASAGKWQPCVEELGEKVRDFDISEPLFNTLRDALSESYHAQLISIDKNNKPLEQANQQGLKSIIQIEMIRVQLLECEDRGSFCVEVAFRARLWNMVSQNLLYDAVLYYPSNFVRIKRPFYETSVGTPSECRTMETYCDSNGYDLLKKEISQSIQSFIERILNDLNLR
jgi:hypothetical protein